MTTSNAFAEVFVCMKQDKSEKNSNNEQQQQQAATTQLSMN